MKPMRWCLAGMLVLTILAGLGCGSKSSGGTGGSFEGKDWVLLAYDTGSGMRGVPLSVSVDARFEGGRVSGNSGVNTYGASYTASGSSLTVAQAVSTMMAGPAEAMQVEQDYLAALARSSSYTASSDTLTIYDKDGGEILSYNLGKTPDLAGVTWKAVSYNNGTGGVVSVLADTTITAVFGEDDTLTGNGGVNNYNATYRAEGSNLTITAPVTTMMAGSTEAMQQEAAYLAALPTAETWRIRGGELELRRKDGALVVSYRVGE